ncbi:hypothetical protein BH11PAT4_BH11PAT4_4880 [soil metagenome]
MKVVLCVRVQPALVVSGAQEEFMRLFGADVSLRYVNPQTPEELDELAANPDVVATYLQEQPLPMNQILGASSGDPNIKPCVRWQPEGLQQITSIKVEGVEFKLPT